MIKSIQKNKGNKCSVKKPIFKIIAKELYKNRILTLMVLPALLYVLIFSYLPMGGIVIAFQNYSYSKGILHSPFIGLKNFEFFFISGQAFKVTFNTVLYNLVFTILGLILQIGAAILLSELGGKYFKKATQSLILLPYFISWVVIGAIVYNVFNFEFGAMNTALRSIGINPVDVLNKTSVWPFIIIFFQAWKGLGYGSVIYLAAITSLDQEMYEAAKIDGANEFQRIRKITLPCLKPTIVTLVLLGLGNIVKGDFGMFYNLTGDNPILYKTTDIIDTFVFRTLMHSSDFGMAAAAGLYQSFLGFVIIMTVNTAVRKFAPEYALF